MHYCIYYRFPYRFKNRSSNRKSRKIVGRDGYIGTTKSKDSQGTNEKEERESGREDIASCSRANAGVACHGHDIDTGPWLPLIG